MKRRFIVSITGEISKEKANDFTNYIKENKLAWWHWLSNTWLIIDSHDKIDIKMIRDKAKEIFASYNLVIEVKDGGWAGFGPKGEDKDMFAWIKKYWSNEKAEE